MPLTICAAMRAESPPNRLDVSAKSADPMQTSAIVRTPAG